MKLTIYWLAIGQLLYERCCSEGIFPWSSLDEDSKHAWVKIAQEAQKLLSK